MGQVAPKVRANKAVSPCEDCWRKSRCTDGYICKDFHNYTMIDYRTNAARARRENSKGEIH